MHKKINLSIIVGILLANFFVSLNAMHNSNRYFPFLEWPDIDAISKVGKSNIAAFFTSASCARRDGDSKMGLPELWGRYDLCNIIQSLEKVRAFCDECFENPLKNKFGLASLINRPIVYSMQGKIRSWGFTLQYDQNLYFQNFSCGFFLPIMHASSEITFCLDRQSSDPQLQQASQSAIDVLDDVRRNVQGMIGLCGADWSAWGTSDLDLYLRWQGSCDHKLLMRSITSVLRFGFLLPTSKKRDINNPASVPFGGNGHWGLYGDTTIDFELRQNLHLGCILGFAKYFPKTSCDRIPVCAEPQIFSALIGPLRSNPGVTLKISPYVILENMVDGFYLEARYTYLFHQKDHFTDERPTCDIEKVPSCLVGMERCSSWAASYFTFKVTYDSIDALKHWPLQPTFYALYDYPIDWMSKHSSETNQFTIGVELHF